MIFDNVEPLNKVLDSIQVRYVEKQTLKFYREENGEQLWGNTFKKYEDYFVFVILNALFDNNHVKREDEHLIFEFVLRFNYLLSVCLQYINEEFVAPLISRFTNRVKDVKRLFAICDDPLYAII